MRSVQGAGPLIPAGERNRRATFTRAVTVTDDHGGETEGTPSHIAGAWVRILYGTGQERREAAQERAQQTATFLANWTPPLATVAATDRISSDGSDWDITNIALVGMNDEIHFTAIRTA